METSSEHAQATRPTSERLSRLAPMIGAGVIGVLLGIAGTLGTQALSASAPSSEVQADRRLADAYSACGSPTGVTLADGGRSLTIDVRGKDDASGASYGDQECILGELQIPSSATSHIEQTTSMDGRQEETWDGVTAAWSYHPSRGSDMVITLADPEP